MNPEEFDQLLCTTRSVRRRIDFARPIEREVLEACIAVAAQAPTGIPPERWRFLVLTEPEPKRLLAELYRDSFSQFAERRPEPPRSAQRALSEHLHEMPALVLVCGLGRPAANSIPLQVAFYGSILPAAWSLMLALRARGIGATWTSLHLLREEEAAQALGIPPDATQTVLLPIGYMRDAVLRPAERLPPDQITYWNRWGNSRPPERDPSGP